MRRYGYNRTNIRDWLNDPERREGCTSAQVGYLREFKQLDRELARIGVVTYFLVSELGVTDARSMMVSAGKQRALICSITKDLRRYKVDGKYEKAFEQDLAAIRRRVDHVYRICQLDLQETGHWPYFEAVGFDRLLDIQVGSSWQEVEELGDQLAPLLEDMKTWEAGHQQEITDHMEKIRPVLERKAAFRERKAALAKAEKEAEKAKKKARDDEIRELKKNNQEYLKRKHKIDREFDALIDRQRRLYGED